MDSENNRERHYSNPSEFLFRLSFLQDVLRPTTTPAQAELPVHENIDPLDTLSEAELIDQYNSNGPPGTATFLANAQKNDPMFSLTSLTNNINEQLVTSDIEAFVSCNSESSQESLKVVNLRPNFGVSFVPFGFHFNKHNNCTVIETEIVAGLGHRFPFVGINFNLQARSGFPKYSPNFKNGAGNHRAYGFFYDNSTIKLEEGSTSGERYSIWSAEAILKQTSPPFSIAVCQKTNSPFDFSGETFLRATTHVSFTSHAVTPMSFLPKASFQLAQLNRNDSKVVIDLNKELFEKTYNPTNKLMHQKLNNNVAKDVFGENKEIFSQISTIEENISNNIDVNNCESATSALQIVGSASLWKVICTIFPYVCCAFLGVICGILYIRITIFLKRMDNSRVSPKTVRLLCNLKPIVISIFLIPAFVVMFLNVGCNFVTKKDIFTKFSFLLPGPEEDWFIGFTNKTNDYVPAIMVNACRIFLSPLALWCRVLYKSVSTSQITAGKIFGTVSFIICFSFAATITTKWILTNPKILKNLQLNTEENQNKIKDKN